jgi:hypothetical protein
MHSKRLPHLEQLFENLLPSEYRRHSKPSRKYNCIALAFGDRGRKWWPGARGTPGCHWPLGALESADLDGFMSAAAYLGYERCDNGDIEPDY